jgi:hypothetical protein
VAKRSTKPKTRNHGTMTEAAFFGWLRSQLRRASLRWRPRAEALKRVRRKYVGPNKAQKWEYQCAKCQGWFKGKDVEVDHIISCGELTTFEQLGVFCERLFTEVEGYQILCKATCHQHKTHGTNTHANP